MEEKKEDRTPTSWAPSHLAPVYCCCHDPEAWRCARSRYGPDFDDDDDPCECCCHEEEIDDPDEGGWW